MARTFYLDEGEELLVYTGHRIWKDPEFVLAKAKMQNHIATGDLDHVFFHEAGHMAHRQSGITPEQQKVKLTPAEMLVAEQVSYRAKHSTGEFLSETYAAMAVGRELPGEAVRLYLEKGGIDLR